MTLKSSESGRPNERIVGATASGGPIMMIVAALFLVVVSPVVFRGAPLADDFHNCLEPQRVGLTAFLADSAERLGAVRPARFLEIFVTNGVCEHLPFGFAIAVPLVLTFAVAVLLRGLLRDLAVRSPWPEIAGAVWLLQPLGTESALWPAALHVPLGLAFALGGLRLHRAGHHGWASLAVAGAALSAEQTILVMPFAAWLIAPPDRRRAALASTTGIALVALASFGIWAGTDERLQASLFDRIVALGDDPVFYVQYPANGLGLHSIPLGVLWAFPSSLALLGLGALVGARFGPSLLRRVGGTDRASIRRLLLVGVGLVALVNMPVILSVPRGGSPRLFAPTWLVLSALLALIGSRVEFRRPVLVGAAAGVLGVGALLSLALSVRVRLHSADFAKTATVTIADHVPDGATVAVCGIRRTVVEPAPRGAFALHEFIYRWSAQDALLYYTGRRASFILGGEVWGLPCPDATTVDAVFRFSDLLRERA